MSSVSSVVIFDPAAPASPYTAVGEDMSLLLTGQYCKKGIGFLSLSLDLIAVREYLL